MGPSMVAGLTIYVGLQVAALAASGCAGSAARKAPPARPWTLASDVAELGRLWRGDTTGCAPVEETTLRKEKDASAAWRCTVAGWNSVTVVRRSARRELWARADSWTPCALGRLARDVERVDSMEGKIVTEVTGIVMSDAFAGACVTASFWYDVRGCSLAIFEARQELAAGTTTDPNQRWRLCDVP
jgi:hypothetical protein